MGVAIILSVWRGGCIAASGGIAASYKREATSSSGL